MAEEVARPRLGRGLAALIGDFGDSAQTPPRHEGQRKVAVEFLRPNPRNPRRHFGEEELSELAGSIKARGLIQPIVVRPLADVPGAFEIVAGERRWRAAQRAGSMKFRWSSSRSTTAPLLNSRSSKTSSGPTSTPSRRPRATSG